MSRYDLIGDGSILRTYEDYPPRDGTQFIVEYDNARMEHSFRIDKNALDEHGSEVYLQKLHRTLDWYRRTDKINEDGYFRWMDEARKQVSHLIDKYGEYQFDASEIEVDALLDSAKVFKKNTKKVIKPKAQRRKRKSFWENTAIADTVEMAQNNYFTTFTSNSTTTNAIQFDIEPAKPLTNPGPLGRLDQDVEKVAARGRKLLARV